ncbi:MAG TPA: hypothetical protein VEB21_20890, partial [Terriglobales bacterium]|nr:hypothetical protein [Terriglobales bacterium]
MYVRVSDSTYFSADLGLSWQRFDAHGGVDSVSTKDGTLYRLGWVQPRSLVIHASSDHGGTWRQMGELNVRQPRHARLIADPSDPDRLYAIVVFSPWESALYFTTDGGRTWSFSFYAGLDSIDLAIAPARGVLYASGISLPFRIFSTVFKSDNGGRDWRALMGSAGTGSIAAHPSNPDVVYAGGTAFLKSIDGGTHWIAIGESLQRAEITELRVRADDPATVFAGDAGGRIFRSRDGGERWTDVGARIALAPIDQIVPIPATTTVLAATVSHSAGGLFRSDDDGESWVDLRSAFPSERPSFRHVAVSPIDSRIVFAMTNDRVLFHSSDGGTSWRTWAALPLPDPDRRSIDLLVSPLTGDTVLYATDHDIFQLQPVTHEWRSIFSGEIDALQFGSSLGNCMVARAYVEGVECSIYRSVDAGLTWRPARQCASEIALNDIRSFGETVYGTNYYGELYRSRDCGDTWELRGHVGYGLGSSGRALYSLVSGAVWQSTDDGHSWHVVSSGPLSPSLDNTDTKIDATNEDLIYAWNGRGVWISVDGAKTFHRLDVGFSDDRPVCFGRGPICDLSTDPRNPGLVYAATGDGIYSIRTRLGRCGNQIVEDGEQCDRGNDPEADTCCGGDCTLRAGEVCRVAPKECFEDATCTAESTECPSNLIKPAGMACTDTQGNPGSCSAGYCLAIRPPTPGPTPRTPCNGDCSRDGEVTVDEIIALVEIALSGNGDENCVLGDADESGTITVDEILLALDA